MPQKIKNKFQYQAPVVTKRMWQPHDAARGHLLTGGRGCPAVEGPCLPDGIMGLLWEGHDVAKMSRS